jgi:uncharacterized protein (TIGR02598 family)
MTKRSDSSGCFSLVEVTIALGIAGISLIAIFGLLPIGAQTSVAASSQTAAVNVLAAVIADMRATPNAITTSGQYQITFGTAQTLYFDDLGNSVVASSPPPTSKYRLDVSYPPSGGLSQSPTYVKLIVTWPAQAAPAKAIGTKQIFAAFDRH